jgi:hypothetical protein
MLDDFNSPVAEDSVAVNRMNQEEDMRRLYSGDSSPV